MVTICLLATSSRTWLLILNMTINMVSTISYDKKLKQSMFSRKFRVNDVNTSTKKVGIWDMDGRPLKVKRYVVTYPAPFAI